MEALSPRDVNAQRMPKATETKTKTVAQLKAAKDKEHPPPPPPEVIEPSSADRPDGAVYHVGKILGKGGFAICYSGQLLPSKQKYALKIVKSQMPSKMEQKVSNTAEIFFPWLFFRVRSYRGSFKRNYKSTRKCGTGTLSSS
jgi:serine/threonine protein kinase